MHVRPLYLPQSMECTILSTTDDTILPCPDGNLGNEFSNVFDDTRADYFRYATVDCVLHIIEHSGKNSER